MLKRLTISLGVVFFVVASSFASDHVTPLTSGKEKGQETCLDCHYKVTPGIVQDFFSGKMAKSGVTCADCHGSDHDNLDKPNVYKCMECHIKQYSEFTSSKHSLAWIAIKDLPAVATEPSEVIKRGCGACHRIGKDGGMCDSCHTRHRFSKAEAKRPEACLPCHAGIEHPQYEMWKSSKHGVIYQTEGEGGRGPSCATCHMDEGNHQVPSAWKFLGLKLHQESEEIELGGYSDMIMHSLGISKKEKSPEELKEAVIIGLKSKENEWQASREAQLKICVKCHSRSYAERTFKENEQLLKETDKLVLEAINIVKQLYKDGILEEPLEFPAHPDHLEFYEVNSIIEQKIYIMYLEHRVRTFMGAFHNNPQYTHWYGWTKIKRDLKEIKEEDKKMRKEHRTENYILQDMKNMRKEKKKY